MQARGASGNHLFILRTCKAWYTWASSCSDRYEIATSAPSRAYASATALPMPESPPVTRAFCVADPHSLMRQAPPSFQSPSTQANDAEKPPLYGSARRQDLLHKPFPSGDHTPCRCHIPSLGLQRTREKLLRCPEAMKEPSNDSYDTQSLQESPRVMSQC